MIGYMEKRPMLFLRSLLIFFILIVDLTLNFLFAADISPKDFYSKPETIISEIKSRGAKEVVRELTKDWSVWDSICDKIASGNQAWLNVAAALQAGTDAGSSETLDLALGEALEYDPKNVLTLVGKTGDLESICSGPDVDNARYNSYELSMKAISLRIKKVAAVNDRSLQKMSKACLHYLEESKSGVAEFYQVKEK
jgi:hypothetical protein